MSHGRKTALLLLALLAGCDDESTWIWPDPGAQVSDGRAVAISSDEHYLATLLGAQYQTVDPALEDQLVGELYVQRLPGGEPELLAEQALAAATFIGASDALFLLQVQDDDPRRSLRAQLWLPQSDQVIDLGDAHDFGAVPPIVADDESWVVWVGRGQAGTSSHRVLLLSLDDCTSGCPTRTVLDEVIVQSLRSAQDDDRVAIQAWNGATGQVEFRLLQPSTAAMTQLATLAGHLAASSALVDFSPDGKRLVVPAESGGIQVLDAATQKRLDGYMLPGGAQLAQLAFADDHTVLARLSLPEHPADPQLYAITPEVTTPLGPALDFQVPQQPAGDARYVLVEAANDTGSAYTLLDLQNPQSRQSLTDYTIDAPLLSGDLSTLAYFDEVPAGISYGALEVMDLATRQVRQLHPSIYVGGASFAPRSNKLLYFQPATVWGDGNPLYQWDPVGGDQLLLSRAWSFVVASPAMAYVSAPGRDANEGVYRVALP